MFFLPVDIVLAMVNPIGVSLILVLFPLILVACIIIIRWLFFGNASMNIKDVLAGA